MKPHIFKRYGFWYYNCKDCDSGDQISAAHKWCRYMNRKKK